MTLLLRSCFALPKFSYVSRTCPPSHINGAAKEFDWVMREALQSIIGGPLSEWSWLKASLPSSRGGINLRSASLHAPAAFLASSCVSQTLVGKMLGHDPGPSPTPAPTWLPSLLLHLVLTGSVWMRLTCLYTSTPFLSSLMRPSINDSYHLLPPPGSSSALPHAGDWLNGVPSTALGLFLHDQEFRCCLRYWLGMPPHSSAYYCPECHSIADPFGDHQVGCGGNGDRITRHRSNAIRDVLFSAAQSAALAPA